jgi:hypothetical protein
MVGEGGKASGEQLPAVNELTAGQELPEGMELV